MLNQSLDIIAALLALIGALNYAWVTFKGHAQPNRVSWLLWTITPSITFAAELVQHVPLRITLLTLAEAVGPLLVVTASLVNRQAFWKVSKFDIWCGVVAALAIVLWLVTGQGNVAIIFSLVASLFSAIPTIIKAYSFPTTESPGDYLASLIAGVLTMLTIQHWTLGNYGFPVYIVLESAVISFLILTPGRIKPRAGASTPSPVPATGGYSPPLVPQTSLAQALPPAAPASLVVSSPTHTPTLAWQAQPDATSYNIYRDAILIGASKAPAYLDQEATPGSHRFWVTAVSSGNESASGNTVDVVVDQTPPSLTFVLNKGPNGRGWHNAPVTVTFVAIDEASGIASCTSPVTLSVDGANQNVIGRAMNYAGDSASVTAHLNIDQSPPELGQPSWIASSGGPSGTSTVAIPVVDHLSGAVAAEYFGASDPGLGKGTVLQIKADFKTDLAPGNYMLHFRAKDAADNWSESVSYELIIAPHQASLS
jgi:hypothetical protein